MLIWLNFVANQSVLGINLTPPGSPRSERVKSNQAFSVVLGTLQVIGMNMRGCKAFAPHDASFQQV